MRFNRFIFDCYLESKQGEESGFFLWEAKYSIKNKNALLDAFYQAKSYALRLNTNGLGIVSMEGVWILLKKDKFLSEKIIHFSWKNLLNSDNFHKLKLLAGKNKRLRKAASV